MKKLVLIAALGVAGVMSANGGNVRSIKESNGKKSGGGYYNVAVATTCGAPYSQRLSFPNAPTQQDLIDIANAINLALCGELGGSATSVKANNQSASAQTK